MDKETFLLELTKRFTNTDSGSGIITSRESQIMLIASEIYTRDAKSSNFETYAEFCIELDRQGMKPIKYEDYLEIG